MVMEEEPRSWGVSPMLSAPGIEGVNEKNTGKERGIEWWSYAAGYNQQLMGWLALHLPNLPYPPSLPPSSRTLLPVITARSPLWPSEPSLLF